MVSCYFILWLDEKMEWKQQKNQIILFFSNNKNKPGSSLRSFDESIT